MINSKLDAYNSGYHYAQTHARNVCVEVAMSFCFQLEHDLIPDPLYFAWKLGFRAGQLEKDESVIWNGKKH